MLKIVLLVAASFVFCWFLVVPVFERVAPPDVVRAYQRLSMPLFRAVVGFTPGYALVETIGRRTGLPRRVPVGGRLSDKTFWFVAGIGRGTDYVRNIEANPRVRVKVRGRWRSGTAHPCPEDAARKRMIRVSPINGLFLLVAGGDHLSVRVDLDQ